MARFRQSFHSFTSKKRYANNTAVKLENGDLCLSGNDTSENGLGAEYEKVQKRKRERWRRIMKRILPHVLLLLAAGAYIVAGGYAFYALERDYHASASRHFAFNTPDTENGTKKISKRNAKEETVLDPCKGFNKDLFTDKKGALCPKECVFHLTDAVHEKCIVHVTGNESQSHQMRTKSCKHLLTLLRRCVRKMSFAVPELQEWTPTSCIFMAFTIISTIGYGHLAPATVEGKLFCIAYGLIGIPLALLAIADQGRFLSAAVVQLYKRTNAFLAKFCTKGCFRRCFKCFAPIPVNEDDEENMPAFLLLCLFFCYIIFGGFLFSTYEEGWSFVDATYFTFVSSSTIGFGDYVATNRFWLPLTLLYVAIGLALATLAIDIFAGYLRMLRHWGEKLRNCANKLVWFGNEKVTLAQLIRAVAAELGASEEKIQDLVENLDAVVEQTVEQEKKKEHFLQPVQLLQPADTAVQQVKNTLFDNLPYIDDK